MIAVISDVYEQVMETRTEEIFGFDRNVRPLKAALLSYDNLSLNKNVDILVGNTDFTISLWARLDGSGKEGSSKILFANDTINGFELSLSNWKQGQPVPEFYIGGRLELGKILGSNSFAMKLDYWHHIILIRKGETVTLMLNNQPAEWREGFTEQGKWMDGWETR